MVVFVMEPKFLKYIKGNKTVLERSPLEKVCRINKLGAFKHNGLWQCMDTIRDKQILEDLVKKICLHKMNSRNILVTGGTGFIGYHILKNLRKYNFNLFFNINKKTQKRRKLKYVKYILCDISKKRIKKKTKT